MEEVIPPGAATREAAIVSLRSDAGAGGQSLLSPGAGLGIPFANSMTWTMMKRSDGPYAVDPTSRCAHDEVPSAGGFVDRVLCPA